MYWAVSNLWICTLHFWLFSLFHLHFFFLGCGVNFDYLILTILSWTSLGYAQQLRDWSRSLLETLTLGMLDGPWNACSVVESYYFLFSNSAGYGETSWFGTRSVSSLPSQYGSGDPFHSGRVINCPGYLWCWSVRLLAAIQKSFGLSVSLWYPLTDHFTGAMFKRS